MFHKNLSELKLILNKNMFPPKLIDETINSYLNDKVLKNVEETIVNENNSIVSVTNR